MVYTIHIRGYMTLHSDYRNHCLVISFVKFILSPPQLQYVAHEIHVNLKTVTLELAGETE